MKKYTNIILIGIILILAAILIGVLLFLKNQPPELRGFEPLVEVKAMEPDSAIWGENFPNQYASLLKTGTNNTATSYGGSDLYSQLIRDPRQVILFTGYGFSKDYNDERGHLNSLIDVRETKRVNDKTPGTCYSCKSSNNPELWDKLGMADYDAMTFSALGEMISEPIGCANCHETGSMRLIVTNPALDEALQAQGLDWTTFTRQEMRTVVCANCHVEYYFAGEGKYLTFPWVKGRQIEQVIAYYDEIGFSDWNYPGTDTPMLKAQHPEFEFFTAGSTHYNAGVSCADCHMPYVRDGAVKYSSHDVKSPLLQAELACGQCHSDVNYVVGRVKDIQDQVFATKQATEDALVDAIHALQVANADPKADKTLLDEARQLHRSAQFMWDFVSAENSMGFHNPEYALGILAKSTNLARQAQMKAARSINDMSLLGVDYFYSLDPVPTPIP
jgi:nitrite reductase (cytochrome c-552)